MSHSEAKEVVDRQLEAGGVDEGARRQWILMNLTRDRDSETYREGFVCGKCSESDKVSTNQTLLKSRWQPNVSALSRCFESDLLLVPSRHLWTPFRLPTR